MARRNYFGEILSLIPKNSARGRRMKAEREMMRTGVMRDTPIVQEVFRAGTSKDFPNQVGGSLSRNKRVLQFNRAKEEAIKDFRAQKAREKRQLLSAFDSRPSYNVPTGSELREQLMNRRDFAGVKRLEQLAEKEKRRRAQAVDTGMSYDVKRKPPVLMPLERSNPTVEDWMRVSQSQTPFRPIQRTPKGAKLNPEGGYYTDMRRSFDVLNPTELQATLLRENDFKGAKALNSAVFDQQIRERPRYNAFDPEDEPIVVASPIQPRRKQKPFDPEDEPNQVPFANVSPYAIPVNNKRTPNPYSMRERLKQNLRWKRLANSYIPVDFQTPLDIGAISSKKKRNNKKINWRTQKSPMSRTSMIDPEREIPRYSTTSSLSTPMTERERRAMRRAEMRASYDVMPDESMNVYRRSSTKKRMTKGSSMSKRQAGPKPNKYF